MLKFDLMLITTFALWISILHNMLCIPSCSEGLKVSFYSWNHVIWSCFEQDTAQKPMFAYFLHGQVLKTTKINPKLMCHEHNKTASLHF
jgi:hypothetical protein